MGERLVTPKKGKDIGGAGATTERESVGAVSRARHRLWTWPKREGGHWRIWEEDGHDLNYTKLLWGNHAQGQGGSIETSSGDGLCRGPGEREGWPEPRCGGGGVVSSVAGPILKVKPGIIWWCQFERKARNQGWLQSFCLSYWMNSGDWPKKKKKWGLRTPRVTLGFGTGWGGDPEGQFWAS